MGFRGSSRNSASITLRLGLAANPSWFLGEPVVVHFASYPLVGHARAVEHGELLVDISVPPVGWGAAQAISMLDGSLRTNVESYRV